MDVDIADLDELKIPGLTLARQQRSRAVTAALLQAALTLLEERSFETLSIADLCKAAGATTGSFYARFESKEVFLLALQHLIVSHAKREMDQRLVPERVAGLTLTEFMHRVAESALRWSRRHEGLIRASLRAAQVDPEAWSPLRELGRYRVEKTIPLILRLLGRPQTAEIERRIRFAFQILYGTQNNMILVNPGPFTIHDRDTPRLLAEAMIRLIDADALEEPGAKRGGD